MVCRKGKCFAVRRHPAARKSSPVPLTLSLILRATQLSPELTHRIPMRPSEVLIPFAHPPRTPPSYPYDPPFIFMIWTLNIHLLESPIPQRRRWRPSGKLREPVCRPPPHACCHVAHGFSESPTGHRPSTRPWLRCSQGSFPPTGHPCSAQSKCATNVSPRGILTDSLCHSLCLPTRLEFK